MAKSTSAGAGSSRGDPLSRDRLEPCDLDELMGKLYGIKNENRLLEQRLLLLEQFVTSLTTALQCSDVIELDTLLQQLTHNSMVKEQSASSNLCAALKQWADTEDRIALHKMMGTEIVAVSDDRFIINVHCYEDNYPHLPPKILEIEKYPNSNMFKMKPKEILFHIDCDEELKNWMSGSTKQEMTKCFQQVQSKIFDTVECDNIYQKLKAQKLLKQSLTCNMCRSSISFMLPKLNRTGDGIIPNTGFDIVGNSVAGIMQNYLSVFLYVEPNKKTKSGWCVSITCDNDPELETVPAQLREIMTVFAKEVLEGSVLDAVTTLLGQVEQLARVNNNDSDDISSSEGDEFAALF